MKVLNPLILKWGTRKMTNENLVYDFLSRICLRPVGKDSPIAIGRDVAYGLQEELLDTTPYIAEWERDDTMRLIPYHGSSEGTDIIGISDWTIIFNDDANTIVRIVTNCERVIVGLGISSTASDKHLLATGASVSSVDNIKHEWVSIFPHAFVAAHRAYAEKNPERNGFVDRMEFYTGNINDLLDAIKVLIGTIEEKTQKSFSETVNQVLFKHDFFE